MKGFLEISLFWGAALSLVAYEAGLLLKRKFKLAIFNPLLIAVICVIAVLVFGHLEYASYYEGGKYISYLLTPATVCLAVPLYEQISLLKKNLKAVMLGILLPKLNIWMTKNKKPKQDLQNNYKNNYTLAFSMNEFIKKTKDT